MFATIRPFLVLFVVTVAVIGGFFVVVTPLFKTTGAQQAEVVGLYDTQTLTAGRPAALPISVDNTGDSQISPLCLGITFSTPVKITSVVFNNDDTETFKDGRVCGGALIGQETINVSLTVVDSNTGMTTMTITPLQDTRSVGKTLRTTLTVTN